MRSFRCLLGILYKDHITTGSYRAFKEQFCNKPIQKPCSQWQNSSMKKSITQNLVFFIIIISAVHASAGRWPPQLMPYTSTLSHSHAVAGLTPQNSPVCVRCTPSILAINLLLVAAGFHLVFVGYLLINICYITFTRRCQILYKNLC